MKEPLKEQLLNQITLTNRSGISIHDLLSRFEEKSSKKLTNEISLLLKNGSIFQKKETLFSAKIFELIPAKINKSFKKFCIATDLNNENKYFIPARFSKDSIFGDIVLIKILDNKLNSYDSKCFLKEGKVVYICSRENITFTGVIVLLNDMLCVKPDDVFDVFFKILNKNKIKLNDKVVAKIDKKNFSFSNPCCHIIKSYGASNKAYNCAKAYIENNGVPVKFSNKILNETSNLKINQKNKITDRLDLTKQTIFTIDSETAKDLDDAISINKTCSGYTIGVHIADVSNFVDFKSKTDKEALKRGNSIYIADMVIPMLTQKLSNDLCSLKPNKIRLTFSILIDLDFKGNILKFQIKKTKIKSKIKGIYEEINQILNVNYKNTKIKNKLLKKYSKVMSSLKFMVELCEILKEKRIKRGSPQLQSNECLIKLNDKNETIDIIKKEQNISEQIVEEFMLLANECVALFAKNNNLAIFYRIHEDPPKEKINDLKETINKLGIKSSKIKPNLKPKVLANLIENHKNSNIFTILNSKILKTMAKAKYFTKPKKHYGLAIENYTHFTSPIRRYCDLTVHRILTEFLYDKKSNKSLNKKYKNFLNKSAKIINKSERNAIKLERNCESYFKAEYMSKKIGHEFDATITHCNKNGMFVQLQNTIEGFIKIETLENKFNFDGCFKLVSKNKKIQFTVGQKIRVKCVAANINSKKIDFVALL